MNQESADAGVSASISHQLGKFPRTAIFVVLVAVVIDQLTKHWAVSHLNDGHVDHVIWTLQWNLSFNGGMAFGQGQGFGPFIAVIATIVVVVLLLSLRQQGSTRSHIPIGLIVGGALGNIIDRLFRGEGFLQGKVIDFIDFQWFPIFNVADMCVDVGGALLVLSYLFAKPKVDHA
ncbi:MAG: signal peptidase II [Ilumatobacteraceae bacterium]|nr:signal peptidase II [Ilumatobacteraceae bacterium]